MRSHLEPQCNIILQIKLITEVVDDQQETKQILIVQLGKQLPTTAHIPEFRYAHTQEKGIKRNITKL